MSEELNDALERFSQRGRSRKDRPRRGGGSLPPPPASGGARLVSPGTGVLTLTGYAPTLQVPRVVTPGLGQLSLSGFASTVTAPQNRLMQPGTGALSLTGYAPSVSATIWTNKPAGLTIRSDYAYNDAIPNPSGTVGGGPWSSINNGTEPSGVRGSKVTDATAPLNTVAQTVLQMRYADGWVGGGSPCTLYMSTDGTSEMYWGTYFKFSDPFENHPASSINKIAFQFSANNQDSTLIMIGSPGKLRWQPQYSVYGTAANGATTITLGAWHKLEWYMKRSSNPGVSADAICKVWMDGVLEINVTTAITPNDAGWGEFKTSPTWGGLNSTHGSPDSFLWYDWTHLASV